MADVLKSAVIASQWWGKKICDAANIMNFDVGGRSQTDTMITLIRTLNASMHTPTPEAAKAFILKLQAIIMRELENNPEHHQVLLQSVESPSKLLREAADDTGIDLCVFPSNRTMMVSRNSVLVSEGILNAYKNIMIA